MKRILGIWLVFFALSLGAFAQTSNQFNFVFPMGDTANISFENTLANWLQGELITVRMGRTNTPNLTPLPTSLQPTRTADGRLQVFTLLPTQAEQLGTGVYYFQADFNGRTFAQGSIRFSYQNAILSTYQLPVTVSNGIVSVPVVITTGGIGPKGERGPKGDPGGVNSVAGLQGDVGINTLKEALALGTKLDTTAYKIQKQAQDQAIATKLASVLFDAHTVAINPHGVTKAQIGLSNVDNTPDATKPLSVAAQEAFAGKVDKVSGKGLSTNDYTNADKTLVQNAATAATTALNAANRIATTYSPNPPALSGIYVSDFRDLPLSAPTGLTIASGGGMIAMTAGTAGTGRMFMPRPVDPTKPWRAAVQVELNDAQDVEIGFYNAAGDNWTGANFKLNQSNLTGNWGGYSGTLNRYGLNTIPVGTKVWVGLASDGNTVQCFLWPENPTSAFNNPGYEGAWNNGICVYSKAVDALYNGNKVFGGLDDANQKYRLSQISFSNKSTTNKILAAWMAQGLEGAQDGKINIPFVVRNKILNDNSGWCLSAGKFPARMVVINHPNANPGEFGVRSGDPNATEVMKLVSNSAGYMLIGIQGNNAPSGYADATASNWGAPAGEEYRVEHLKWWLANLKGITAVGLLGQSMGSLGSLAYIARYPNSVRCLYTISGVHSIPRSIAEHGFGATVQKAYGTFYVCTQAGTGQNPTTATAYWKQVSYANGAPEQSYYDPATYTWKDQYAAGTAYAVGDVVVVPNTNTAPGYYRFNDPTSRPSAFVGVPIKAVVGANDGTISPDQAIQFGAAVNALGGNVQVVVVPGAGHLTANMVSAGDIVAFFNLYMN